MRTIQRYARIATNHWAYMVGLLLVHSVAKYTSHAYVMRGSERYSPKPFPTYELCRDLNGRVTCSRARMGLGPPCQERCQIHQQMTTLSKSKLSGVKLSGRAPTR